MDVQLDWLLEGPAWVRYRALVDLAHEPETSPQEQAARREMLADPQVTGLVRELQGWPGVVLNSHKSAGQLYHKLRFAADLGLRRDDPGMPHVVHAAMAHQSEQGPFQLSMAVSVAHGGTGHEDSGWALCDAPVIVGTLCELGLSSDPSVRRAVDFIAGLARDNGWPCAVSPELKDFRGPGRKGDPCPYATLACIEMELAAGIPHERQTRAGAEALLTQWSGRRESHPYMFYMGTDFSRLKAPFIWYDILHVADALSRIPWLRQDPRLQDMVRVMMEQVGTDGRATPGSVWMAWKDWEFGQKKVPSRWVTLVVERVRQRMSS
ncbi:MAG TPA: hypothetical protein VN478_01220 [Clostridia bacterium]|nr:hypothetical protein [Clostridia bacterium]